MFNYKRADLEEMAQKGIKTVVYTGMVCLLEGKVESKATCMAGCRGDYDEGGFACSHYAHVEGIGVDTTTGMYGVPQPVCIYPEGLASGCGMCFASKECAEHNK